MAYEKYNGGDFYHHGRKSSKVKWFIFLCFLGILTVILLPLFYEDLKLTGNSIDKLDKEKTIKISSSLTFPEIILDGSYEEIILSIKQGSFVNFDGKKILLDETNNIIILEGFEGFIELNENEIKRLDGRVSDVKINNMFIDSEDKSRSKFSISKDSEYNLFKIDKDVYLKDIHFLSSGSVSFNGDSLKINSEKIRFLNYLGSLRAEKGRLYLEGITEEISIEGDLRKIKINYPEG